MVYLPCKERLNKSIFCQIKLQQSFNYIAPIFGVATVTASCKRKPVCASTMTKHTTASLLKMWMLNETNILAVIKQKNIVFKQTCDVSATPCYGNIQQNMCISSKNLILPSALAGRGHLKQQLLTSFIFINTILSFSHSY